MQKELEMDIIKNLFHERCFDCGGFLLLDRVKGIDENLAIGVVSCADCEIKLNMHFHLLEASH